ncbi:fimbrial protein [Escherichia coli]
MQNNRISGVLIFALLTAVVHPVPGLASELGFKGNLLDRPCQVAAESLQQEVVFKTRPAKDFWYYSPGYSPAESFSVKLVNCHPSTMGEFSSI